MDILNLIRLVLSSGLPCCLLAIGVFLTFRILDFADMTAEGSLLLGGSTCVVMLFNGVPAPIATICGMLVGGACGFITGCLNRLLKIPKLLSGIITMTASASLALLILGFSKTPFRFTSLVTLTDQKTIFSFLPASIFKGWQIPIVTSAIVILMIFVIYFFFGTEYGMAIRATGINERMAKAQGINTTITTIVCITISNALIGLAGALICQIEASMNTASATGYLVVGLASILIGETVFGKRSFKNSLISICLGSIVYFTIISLATFVFHMPSELSKILYAVLIVLALCLPMIKEGIMKLWNKIFKKKTVEVK